MRLCSAHEFPDSAWCPFFPTGGRAPSQPRHWHSQTPSRCSRFPAERRCNFPGMSQGRLISSRIVTSTRHSSDAHGLAAPEVPAGRGIGWQDGQMTSHPASPAHRQRQHNDDRSVERAVVPRLRWALPASQQVSTGAPPGTRTPNPRIKPLVSLRWTSCRRENRGGCSPTSALFGAAKPVIKSDAGSLRRGPALLP